MFPALTQLRQNRSNGLQQRFGDIKTGIKRTTIREVSNFFFELYRSFAKEHAALVKLGSKREYVSASVCKHNCTRFHGISRWSLPWLKIVNEQTVSWVAINGDLPYAKWTVNLPWHLVMCTRHVSQGSKWSGRQASSNKRGKTEKKDQETSYKKLIKMTEICLSWKTNELDRHRFHCREI